MSDLMRQTQKSIVMSKSMSGVAGKGLVVSGGVGLGLWAVAGILPFISLPMLLVIMIVGGVFLWE